MKIVFALSLIILMGEANNFVLEARPDEQKAHLAKLQNLDQVSKERIVPWNEILAGVLVNKINIFHSKNDKEQKLIVDTNDDNVLRKCLSEALYFYKKYVYDTFFCHNKRDSDNRGLEDNPRPTDEVITDDIIPVPTLDVPNKKSTGPKAEVELVEPRYHGKVQEEDNTNETTDNLNITDDLNLNKSHSESTNPTHTNINVINTKDTKDDEIPNIPTDCPKGQLKNPEGECVDSNSKYILFVPNHCPIGYIKDRRGFCRPLF